MQENLAALSDSSDWQVTEAAGHFIRQDPPELVVDAIRRVVESSRSAAGGVPRILSMGPLASAAASRATRPWRRRAPTNSRQFRTGSRAGTVQGCPHPTAVNPAFAGRCSALSVPRIEGRQSARSREIETAIRALPLDRNLAAKFGEISRVRTGPGHADGLQVAGCGPRPILGAACDLFWGRYC